jgi:glycerate kinase
VGAAIADGLRSVWGDGPVYDVVPMADGGDGTVAAFLSNGATARTVRVRGPLGEPVDATYAIDRRTAVIEMAAASGLALLGNHLDARHATTYGTGELIRDALDQRVTGIILGIGGSATTDGGAGALAALGLRFLDAAGVELEPTPAALMNLATIDRSGLDFRLGTVPISVACDVTNPLLGPHGAAAIYGPQKGAGSEDIVFLDAFLERFATVAETMTERRFRDEPGAGASGGLGWGLAMFASGFLRPGFDLIATQQHVLEKIEGAHLVCTGEGRIDEQTLRGKVVAGMAILAASRSVPVVAFGGSVDPAAEVALSRLGVACMPIATGPMALAEAMHTETAIELIRAAAARVARLLR